MLVLRAKLLGLRRYRCTLATAARKQGAKGRKKGSPNFTLSNQPGVASGTGREVAGSGDDVTGVTSWACDCGPDTAKSL
jgi:hypothetical protein